MRRRIAHCFTIVAQSHLIRDCELAHATSQMFRLEGGADAKIDLAVMGEVAT